MITIKHNASTIVKLILNHAISSLYALVLMMIVYAVFGVDKLFIASIVSIVFYFYLVYSFMWYAGAKDANSFYHNDLTPYGGFGVIAVATLPSIITNLIASVMSLWNPTLEYSEYTFDFVYSVFYYINGLFMQNMYSGIFASFSESLTDISPWLFLASVIPGIVVGGVAYMFGYKSYRLRTLFGIEYDEEKEKIKKNY